MRRQDKGIALARVEGRSVGAVMNQTGPDMAVHSGSVCLKKD